MKLKIKALCTALITITASSIILWQSFIHQTIFGAFFGITASLLLLFTAGYLLFIRKIESLNKQITDINLNNLHEERVILKGDDDINSIAHQVNILLTEMETRTEEFSLEEKKYREEIQKSNLMLEQEISNHLATTKTLEWNRECLQSNAAGETTTLPNRMFFNETLSKAMKHANRRNKVLAIIILEVDTLKKLNFTFDAPTVETFLASIGNDIVKTLRTEDVVAKLSESEFVILLTDINKAKFATSVAEKLLEVCAIPHQINNETISLKVSMGICIYPNDATNLEDLIKCAYKSLDKAKSINKSTYQFYTAEMNAEAHEFMQLRVGLRKALFNNELELFYQPRLHLKRGSIVGIEALMRWNHPKLGLINPSKFIPIAEETGLIFEIGDWALREACKINKKWQDKGQGHLTMSVNLSSKQFFHPLIDETIAKILRETELNPKYLELEITERDIMEDVAQATIILNKLKNIGVQIAIDHFGSGYTSISYLKQFPVNVIKIDPGFIKGVQINPNDSAITSAIIALVHNLGLEVIAEGVETAEQVLFLGNHNCDMVQGYYLSHPLPAHKIILQFKNLMDNVMI